jgi:hypothetical protein
MPRDLRKMARGQECYLRLPGHCSGNTETVVLAHIRRGNIAGTGQKPCDLAAMPMCHVCHSCFDGRMPTPLQRTIIDAEALRGLVQWLSKLSTEGAL